MAVAPEGSAPPSFLWGGRGWSASNLGEFKRWLAAHGTNYAQWAANHADTARSVFGALPAAGGGLGDAAGSAAGGTADAPGAGSTAPIPTDYQSLIENDPVFQALKNSLSAQGISDASSRAAAIQKLLIGYGAVPDISGTAAKLGLSDSDLAMLKGDITSETSNLAQKNTNEGTSLVSRLAAAHQDAARRVMDALGASGLFHSGATAKQVGDEELHFKQGSSDALDSLLGSLGGVIGNYTQGERARQAQIGQGLSDAAARQQGLMGSTTPVAAKPVAHPGVIPAIRTTPKANRASVLRSLIISGRL